MNTPTRPTAEIARLGKEIYQRDIQPKVEGGHHGEYVAIDVGTGRLGHRQQRARSVGGIAGAVPRCY